MFLYVLISIYFMIESFLMRKKKTGGSGKLKTMLLHSNEDKFQLHTTMCEHLCGPFQSSEFFFGSQDQKLNQKKALRENVKTTTLW